MNIYSIASPRVTKFVRVTLVKLQSACSKVDVRHNGQLSFCLSWIATQILPNLKTHFGKRKSHYLVALA